MGRTGADGTAAASHLIKLWGAAPLAEADISPASTLRAISAGLPASRRWGRRAASDPSEIELNRIALGEHKTICWAERNTTITREYFIALGALRAAAYLNVAAECLRKKKVLRDPERFRGGVV